jgi:hypothetical protein
MDCCTGTCRTSCGCSAGGCGRPSPQARRFSFAAQRTRCPRSAACRMPHRCIRCIRWIATYVARTVAANKKLDGTPHVVACCTVRVHVSRVAWSCVARCALRVACCPVYNCRRCGSGSSRSSRATMAAAVQHSVAFAPLCPPSCWVRPSCVSVTIPTRCGYNQ